MFMNAPLSKVAQYQSLGFLAIIALTWLDELVALPSLIFGHSSMITDFRESTLKMLLVLAVWFLVACSTRRLLVRVRYLEGFMRICAWCHHIDFKGDWISLEDFLRKGFDTPTTHGICPGCLTKEKAALARAREVAAQKATASTPAVACSGPS